MTFKTQYYDGSFKAHTQKTRIESGPLCCSPFQGFSFKAHTQKTRIERYPGLFGFQSVPLRNKILDNNKNDTEALLYKGYCSFCLGNHKEEEECFQKALKINPNDSLANYNMGITLYNSKRYDEALEKFKISESLYREQKKYEESEKALYYYNQSENAIELIDKITPIDKEFIKSLDSKDLIELKDRVNKTYEDVNNLLINFSNDD